MSTHHAFANGRRDGWRRLDPRAAVLFGLSGILLATATIVAAGHASAPAARPVGAPSPTASATVR